MANACIEFPLGDLFEAPETCVWMKPVRFVLFQNFSTAVGDAILKAELDVYGFQRARPDICALAFLLVRNVRYQLLEEGILNLPADDGIVIVR